ncbi:MAG TPA: hypothetical protein VFF26_09110 [Gallionella sp.]|nr:hypothetical protein [Gallionella sp.]
MQFRLPGQCHVRFGARQQIQHARRIGRRRTGRLFELKALRIAVCARHVAFRQIPYGDDFGAPVLQLRTGMGNARKTEDKYLHPNRHCGDPIA